MHKANAADELAEVRAAIARLRLREARLCAKILAAPETAEGDRFRVQLAERRFRLFDPALLPEGVLSDPRYWRESVTRELCCYPRAEGAPAPAPRPSPCALH